MNNHLIDSDLGYDLSSLDELETKRIPHRNRIRRVPFDYVAKFQLQGKPGTRIPATVNISAESWFICTSIGYSLVEPMVPETDIKDEDLKEAKNKWYLLSRSLLSQKLTDISRNTTEFSPFQEAAQLDTSTIQNLRESLSFTYAIKDTGSGRELQNEPIHNLAGLGKADGTRPFRELVVPYVFAPNSSIIIELREINTIKGGTVHMVFQGFKEYR